MKNKLAINGGEKTINLDSKHYIWPPITDKTKEVVLNHLKK